MNPYAVVAQLQTPVMSLEIRDNVIEEEGQVLIASRQALLGAALTPIPDPSMSRSALSTRQPYGKVGDITFIPFNVPWHFLSGRGRFRTVTGSFSPETFARVTRHRDDWSELELRHCSDIRNPGIARTLHTLAGEAAAPGFGSAVMAEGLGLYLLVELARHFASLGDAPARLAGLSSRQLQAVQDYVREVSGKQPTLTELAAMCGLGRRTFMRRFKASTGQTVSGWVAEQQAIRATALLRDSALPLKQIAFTLGFSSASNFASAFRRSTGFSPSECRRRAV